MINYYNAFISYRHAPLDSKVAEHVQRSLEHFSIPRSIRKKTGVKRIERIFRDKDELPITSDLTETISNALEKADYLIVICSPNTKESMWVQREIEYFLKNHTKKQILTVLADGEPEDVIPEILTYEDHEVSEFWKEAHTIRMPIEPLSCDYRMPFRKAKKEEIPRLASALIGCSYDELIRRQRAYRVRRGIAAGAAIVAASLALTLYTLRSKQKVDEALVDSLASQSRYLANQSTTLMEDHRRIDAIYLALAALPQGEDDTRPVVPEAVSALTNATLAYRGLAGDSIDTVWNYSLGSQISGIELSPSGTRLAATDESGSLAVWNTETHDQLMYLQSVITSGATTLMFIDDSKLLVRDYNKLYCYNADNGALEWTYDNDDQRIIDDPEVCGDGLIIFVDIQGRVSMVDIGSGELRNQDQLDMGLDSLVTANRFSLSPNGNKLAIAVDNSMNSFCIYEYDISSGRVSVSTEVDGFLQDVAWADDEHFVAASIVLDNSSVSNARFNGSYIMGHDPTYIYCFDADSANVVWSAEQIATNVSFNSGFIDLSPNNMVAYYSANICGAYDIDDGTLCYEWNANESIVDVSDRDNDGWPILITREGGLVSVCPSLAVDVINVSYEFPDNLSDADVNHGVYLYQDHGTQIYYYNVHISDEDWQCIDDIDALPWDSYMSDDYLAILTGSYSSCSLMVVDPTEAEVMYEIPLGNNTTASEYSFLGEYDGDLYLIRPGVGSVELYKVDLARGRVTSDQISEAYVRPDVCASMTNETVVLYNRISGNDYVTLYNVISHRSEDYQLGADYITYTCAPQYFEDIGMIYAGMQEGDAIVFTEDDEYVEVALPDTWYDTEIVRYDPETRRVMVSDRHEILILDELGDEVLRVSSGGRIITGYTILHGEQYGEGGLLLVSHNDGSLMRYDALTGEFMGNSEMSYYYNYVPDAEFTVDSEAGLLYIFQHGLLSVIDLESWVEYAYVENSFGHHGPTDRFYTYAYEVENEPQLGYFRHYTIEELIAKANEILGGIPMPEELRTLYGL
ncbi:MAG: TIR domain-containing protein [Clostridiales bacterium]|nr:TIR domain-containing protein [Clostridiales bacterium]